MYHLRLIKALSYHGIVKATKKNPDAYTDDKATAEAAVATGYFEIVGKPTVADKTEDDKKDLSKMTVTQLKAYAEEHGIDLTGHTTKSDIIEAINSAEDNTEAEAAPEYETE